MRQTMWVTIPAGKVWPASAGGIDLPRFNWALVENRSAANLYLAFGPVSQDAGDYGRLLLANNVRIFNCGPERSADFDADSWPNQLHVLNPSGASASVLIEIADYPLHDYLAGLASPAIDVTDRAGRLLGVVASITAAVDISDRAARALGAVSPAAASVWDVSDRAGRAVGAVSPAAASTWDVSDRSGRAVGAVSPAAASVWDVADRAARLLGTVSPVAASTWDVSDRAGRLVGAVSPAAASVWDVADRAGRLLGVIASITAAVDISDRAARLLGIVSPTASRLDAANLCVTNTGIAGAAVTLTIPAVAAQFHYLGFIQVVRFASALLTAAAAPVLVTTTNLPGGPVLSFPADAAAAGTEFIETIQPATPIKSSAVNTNTTIVCPATPLVIWRVSAWYYAAT